MALIVRRRHALGLEIGFGKPPKTVASHTGAFANPCRAIPGTTTHLRYLALDTNFVLHYYCAMKNVTITLNEEVARWVRIHAAKRESSVSKLVGELLREKMLSEERYSASMQHYISQSPTLLKQPGEKYPTRENLHDR